MSVLSYQWTLNIITHCQTYAPVITAAERVEFTIDDHIYISKRNGTDVVLVYFYVY